MEKFENKNKETKPFVADYDAVLNEVYLGLAREKDLPNSFGASNFEEYLSTNFPDDTERFKVEVMLGADFDRSIIDLICNAMIFRRQSLIMKMKTTDGLGGGDYLPLEDMIQERLKDLRAEGALDVDLNFAIERVPACENEEASGIVNESSSAHSSSQEAEDRELVAA